MSASGDGGSEIILHEFARLSGRDEALLSAAEARGNQARVVSQSVGLCVEESDFRSVQQGSRTARCARWEGMLVALLQQSKRGGPSPYSSTETNKTENERWIMSIVVMPTPYTRSVPPRSGRGEQGMPSDGPVVAPRNASIVPRLIYPDDVNPDLEPPSHVRILRFWIVLPQRSSGS